MIIIGLGTGRCGTASLAHLLNSQRDAICFHEMNPSCVRFAGTPRPILNTIDEFQAVLDGGDPSMLTVDLSRRVSAQAYDRLCQMPKVSLIGDIGFYYLSYVETIANHNANVRFICLKRDRDATVQSWLKKTTISRWPSKTVADRLASLLTREPYFEARNPWMEHDGSEWLVDDVFDKCFPKFPGPTREKAIYQYWDYYYEKAEELERIISDVFLIFDVNDLNKSQEKLLDFCGLELSSKIKVDAHIHKSI